MVLWNEIISLFDDLQDHPFQIKNLRVNLSRFKTLELHTINGTEFNTLESSEIPEDPTIRNINEIKPQQNIGCIQGLVHSISDEREFSRSDGTTGRVASMTVEDTTGPIRVVAWDDNVEKITAIREEEMKFVKIFFGRIRQKDDNSLEMHLSPLSHVRPSSRIPVALRGITITEKEPSPTQSVQDYQKTQLSELSEESDGISIEILGKVIRLFQQTPYYQACPECRKKVTEVDSAWVCQEHEIIDPQIRFRLSGLLDDGTGTIRTTFFGLSGEILTGMKSTGIQKLIDNELTDDQIFDVIQQEAEGKTVLIQGTVRLQTREIQGETIQSQELFANRVRFPSPKMVAEELISELQES